MNALVKLERPPRPTDKYYARKLKDYEELCTARRNVVAYVRQKQADGYSVSEWLEDYADAVEALEKSKVA